MEFEESLIIRRVDDIKLTTAAKRMEMMTVHCQLCNTVLTDSFGVCGEMESLDSLMCIKVTNDVVVGGVQESGHKGEMANCIFSPLKCRSCHSVVGKVVHSTPSRWASVRSVFLLYKASISCYILDSNSTVEASVLSFRLKPLRESINEVRQQVEEQRDQMMRIHSRVADRSITSEVD
ncbi:protein Mis18-beta [Kryptolebias marmoratus]|uniref:Protein Mis18-beta-like n=1 Tax=Kryptolebias marmoratus TaxID=37003 RepID=A0A3Q3AXI0_KRYMA|nr:protein Mis18-beta [Kryptolebias marmoratus]